MNEISLNPADDPRDVLRRGPDSRSLAAYDLGDEVDDDGLDLRWILQVLLARWYWILAAAALGLAAALAISLTIVPLYRTAATLELNPPSVPIMAAGPTDQAMNYPSNDWQFLPTQLGLMKSRDLAKRVVEDLGLAQDRGDKPTGQALSERIENEAGQLAAGIGVSLVPDSRLVELSYTSASAQDAAKIVNAYANAFIQGSIDRRFESTANTREFLADQLEVTRTKLNQSERAMVDYARANNIIMPGASGEDGSAAASLTATSLVSLNGALAVAQQRRIATEQRYRQAGSISENQSATASLRSEKAGLEAEYREKATFLGEDYPDMVRLRARINSLDQAIRNASGSASSGLGAEFRAALAEESALRARVQQLSGSVLAEQELSAESNVLQREIDTQQSLYQALLDQYNQIGVVEGVGAPAAIIVDNARIPTVPYTPNIPRNLILGLILGLGIGAAAAIGYEMLTDLIKTDDDVREKLKQSLLGTIPKLGRGEDLTDEVMDPKSPISEAYGSLLTTLLFSTSQGLPKVFTVTSSSEAEGKSTTSLVLAKRLATAGKKVILIDGDMRRPSFFFEGRDDVGLSQLLTGDREPSDHILRTQTTGLFVLPSGPIPPNPSMLLNSPEMRELIVHLRALSDHVIIDCPPTLGFSDSSLLGSVSDGTILIVESGKTRRRTTLDAIRQLQAAGNKVLGVVLTKCPKSSLSYGYNYGYYSNYTALGDHTKPHALTPDLYGNEASS
jgi:capsular exopolysaccharide synthesis family protein